MLRGGCWWQLLGPLLFLPPPATSAKDGEGGGRVLRGGSWLLGPIDRPDPSSRKRGGGVEMGWWRESSLCRCCRQESSTQTEESSTQTEESKVKSIKFYR